MSANLPASVEESRIPACIRVAECGTKLLYTDMEGDFHILTNAQLEEVAAVYNAWRVGNLQDCTIRTPGDIKL